MLKLRSAQLEDCKTTFLLVKSGVEMDVAMGGALRFNR